MPAHISHELFARDAFRRVSFVVDEENPSWVLGAQGPDLFLHNHRTKPSSLIFGKLLHTEGYGTFVGHLVSFALKSGHNIDSPLGAYIAGFCTHASLDRRTHPFINYFSGWVERDNPESQHYYHCHAFLERIIDVFLLQIRSKTNINEYDFFSRINCGERLPDLFVDAMTDAIMNTFSEYDLREDIQHRIQNGYRDSWNFYQFTNPPTTSNLLDAYRYDHEGKKPSRRLVALFHPRRLPDLDYLNAAKKAWCHPGIPDEIHHESFMDLYKIALDDAEKILTQLKRVFLREAPVSDLSETMGNQNLSDGREKKTRRQLKNVAPLPLEEVLHTVYMDLSGQR